MMTVLKVCKLELEAHAKSFGMSIAEWQEWSDGTDIPDGCDGWFSWEEGTLYPNYCYCEDAKNNDIIEIIGKGVFIPDSEEYLIETLENSYVKKIEPSLYVKERWGILFDLKEYMKFLEELSYELDFKIEDNEIVWNYHYIEEEDSFSIFDEGKISILCKIIDKEYSKIYSVTTSQEHGCSEDGDFFGTIWEKENSYLIITSGYEFTNYNEEIALKDTLVKLLEEAKDYYDTFETESEEMEEVIDNINKKIKETNNE